MKTSVVELYFVEKVISMSYPFSRWVQVSVQMVMGRPLAALTLDAEERETLAPWERRHWPCVQG